MKKTKKTKINIVRKQGRFIYNIINSKLFLKLNLIKRTAYLKYLSNLKKVKLRYFAKRNFFYKRRKSLILFKRFNLKKRRIFFNYKKQLRGYFYKTTNLLYYSYYIWLYKKYNYLLLKERTKKRRSNLYIYNLVLIKKNKLYKLYTSFIFFFNNFLLEKNFLRKLVFFNVFKKMFFFKQQRSILKFLNLNKNDQKSYLNLSKKLNFRLVNYLYNLGLKNSSIFLTKNIVYVNGFLVNYKNIQLKNNDLLYLNFNKSLKSQKDFLYIKYLNVVKKKKNYD